MQSYSFLVVMLVGALAPLGCGPDNVTTSKEAAGVAEETSSDGPSDDLPPDDPRWCVKPVEGAEVRTAMTELDIECGAEISAEACEANPACTAVFGRPIVCPAAGACTNETVEFLGCIPFTLCKQGAAVYCREIQGYLVTYASQQGGCTPFGMMDCVTSPDYAAMSEQPPNCP